MICNSNLWFLLIVITGTSIISCKKPTTLSQSSCGIISKPADTYIYPVKPGTAEWNNLPTSDYLKVCQIPDSTLKKISTDGLIQSWLDFPLASEIFLANSIPKAVEFFINNFSGLKELCSRSNAGYNLLERYKGMVPACITSFSKDIDRGDYALSFIYIEMLTAQDTILNTLSIDQRKLLVSEAIKKSNEKNNYSTYFGQLGQSTCMYVCARTMKYSLYQPFLNEINNSTFLLQFLNNLLLPQDKAEVMKMMNTILTHSLNFIK